MERIWAPWRIRYILESRTTDCIFCAKPAEEDSRDRENHILERGGKCFTMMNTFPYNNGHLMIAPYTHTGNLEELAPGEICEISLTLQRWLKILKEALSPDGFNIGVNLGRVAGAGFAGHVHYHIVPRWDGDTNFMPVIGETKVVNQSMEACYDWLLKHAGGKPQAQGGKPQAQGGKPQAQGGKPQAQGGSDD